MAKSVFDRINEYITGLPDKIEKGMTIVTIREVDRYALEFFRRVQQETKSKRLKGNIALTPYVKTSRQKKYGYYLKFDGYDENNTPLQMIANVINTGRVAGSGTAESGRHYAYGIIEGNKFMTRNLELLKGIDISIAKATDLMKWVVADNQITLSDGTTINLNKAEIYIGD